MVAGMDLQTIEFTRTVSVSRATSKTPDWPGAVVRTIGGIDFLELEKKDKGATAWMTGYRVYSTNATNVIKEICDIQDKASMEELGQDEKDGKKNRDGMSAYRLKVKARAMKQLCEGLTSPVVNCKLPSFTLGDDTVDAVLTELPVSLSPVKALVPLRNEVMQWVYLRAQFYKNLSDTAKRSPSSDEEGDGRKPQKASRLSEAAASSSGQVRKPGGF